MDLNEIQALIKFVAKSGVSEVELETKEIKISIKAPTAKVKGGEGEMIITSQMPAQGMPAVQQVPVQQAAPAAKEEPAKEKSVEEEAESKYITITSPMIGTFYRSSSPDKPPFVNVGDDIAPGKVICIIEAMKLFNEIEAEVSGKIIKVLVDDAAPVEYDQPLFLVDPK